MSASLDTLQAALEATFGDKLVRLVRERGEITATVRAADYAAVARSLRDEPALRFEQLIDLCGLDYSSWKNAPCEGLRYCVV
jgi:NADH-quinone oxidoreductase subunit C